MSELKSIQSIADGYTEIINTFYESKIEEYKAMLLEILSHRFNAEQYIVEEDAKELKSYYRIVGFGVHLSKRYDELGYMWPYLNVRKVLKNMRESERIYRLGCPNDENRIIVDVKEVEAIKGHKRGVKSYSDKYLYVFRNPYGDCKIGQAINVEDRRKSIEMQSGMTIELLISVPKSAEYESKLHELYSRHRKIGEWFSLPKNEILWLSVLDRKTLEGRFNGLSLEM